MPPNQITRITLRRAIPRDASAIARAHVDSWQAAYLGLIPAAVLNRLTVPVQTANWRRILDADETGTHTWVIANDSTVLGFSSAGPCRDDDDNPRHVGEIYTLYLIPAAWSRGLGSELLDTAQSGLARRGLSAATLWVLAGNTRARRFYELNGFVPDGARRPTKLGDAELTEMRYRRAL
ncbi:GNAT family N-acetyltransferase [Chondromyces apiculatus]|uniref:GCN5-related N-acetyltransferase n=1 Tax=Chondromyces apiculatus DSM 436 TaxID=1192034 RepID=A0A017T4Y7_9BACT|nr:GNAT family N-acetyltransferase [Chondromyces apiculatus]EYF04304.1 GCN5-related N-acetyltransferase [Chondromyces apiculatus DSM 436]